MSSPQKLSVGIIGAGEVAQVIHLPTLSLLSHLYTITAICDISATTASHCATKFHIPTHTTDPYAITSHPAIDVVFILTSDEFHETYAIAALTAGKRVFLEKPLTLSLPSARRILAATNGDSSRLFVGYMRRYAPSFLHAFKRELASLGPIQHARARDFSGPNKTFVDQSGTFQLKGATDVPASSGEKDALLAALLAEAFPERDVTPERQNLCRFLGSLGSHDVSLLREAVGMPEAVVGVSAAHPFYTALLRGRNSAANGGAAFGIVYESGIDAVPEFDAHLAVYGRDKRIEIRYDSPYVKGLPIKVRVVEVNEHGEVQSREVLSSYEDAYTAELREMHECFTQGKEVKTTVEDAMEDLRLFDMIYQKYEESIQA